MISSTDIKIEINSDISGSSTYSNITNRIIEVGKIFEKAENKPGEYEISEFEFTVNNFDNWYDLIYLNYFYEDPNLSGQNDVYCHVFLNDTVLWAGFLKEVPIKNYDSKTVNFKFNNLLDKLFDRNFEISILQ